MAATAEDHLIPIVRRLALVFALTTGAGLPGAYFSTRYLDHRDYVESMAEIKAASATLLVAANPEFWTYQVQRLEEVLLRPRLSLDETRATVFDAAGNPLVSVGTAQQAPVLVGAFPVYDSGRVVGRVEVVHSYRDILNGTLLAGLLGLLLGILVYFALLVLPLRALRRANAALAEEKTALQGAEEQFRSLVEQSISGIYITQDNKFAYVNPRLAEIGGYGAAEELIGRDPISMIAGKDRSRVEEVHRRLNAGETRSVSYDFTALRKDGSTTEVGVHASRASYRGRPATIGVLQDISEKKRAEGEIQQYIEQLKRAFMSTVEVATTLGEMRDPYTAGHERRVAEIAVAIGAELGWDASRLEGLRVAGYLHDVGKITIPSEILSKPGKLSAIEYMLIQGHAQAGYEALKGVKFPWPVAEAALQHHERIDGSGYPQGLKGEAILPEARVLAVADVVEAMSSHRPYRPGLGTEAALAEIKRGRGSAYDPDAADACLKLFREKGYAIPA